MATDFSRTLSLLRQEKGVSQRKAAAELGISQALLSHYENGIREPGLAFVTRSSWGDGSLHEGLEAVGLGLIVICIVGRAWCSLYIGGRKKAEIVDRGPYSISRNPLYVFSFMGAFGVGAQTYGFIHQPIGDKRHHA